MEMRTFRPYFAVIILMALTSIALELSVDVNITDEAGIRVELPDRIAAWEGNELRYCHNKECLKAFLVNDIEDRNVCPACGGPLSGMSYDEAAVLPGDTVLMKKRYVHPTGRQIFVSIVLSGASRSSIHRPQMCLTGQGQVILKSEVLEVPIEGRKPLDVMVLDLEPQGRAEGMTGLTTYYAYWFVGKGRETPSHVQRMIWMSTDRIFHNVAHRWAYIAVSGAREEDSVAYLDEIREFIGGLYPHIALTENIIN